jgi:HEAT repeat protein
MEVLMRRVFPVILLFTCGSFGTSLAGDEPRAGGQPVGDLIKQLGDKKPDTVCAAAKALGDIKTAKDAVPALKEVLKNRNSRMKLAAAEALWRLEHKATDLLPVYGELLTASDAEVRAASAWRLGRFGSDARPIVPLLAAALRDENFEVRVQVGQALANLGPWAEPALPALVRALGDKQLDEPEQVSEGLVRVRTSPALPALLEMADDAIPLLIEKFREDAPKRQGDESNFEHKWEERGRVALAFPAFRGRAVAPLLQALESKDEKTRIYAALALSEMAQLHGLPPTTVQKLEQFLDGPDTGVRTYAARAVSSVRPSNAKAVTIILKSDEDRAGGRKELLADLARLSPHNEEARTRLFGLLTDKDAETVAEAHRILAGLKLPTDQVLGVWIKALAHADPKVRSLAVETLPKFGSGAKPAKAVLYERFKKEEDRWTKSYIFGVLTAIDPDDPALVPFLIDSLEDSDAFLRSYAVDALADLGPKAKDATPRIEACLQNPRQKAKQNESDALDEHFLRGLLIATVRIAPSSTKSVATLLEALRHRDIRSLIGAKNSWYMRDELEDHLLVLQS